MSLALAITAVRHGAFCLNYTKVQCLLKTCVNGQQQVCGAKVVNTITGQSSPVTFNHSLQIKIQQCSKCLLEDDGLSFAFLERQQL